VNARIRIMLDSREIEEFAAADEEIARELNIIRQNRHAADSWLRRQPGSLAHQLAPLVLPE